MVPTCAGEVPVSCMWELWGLYSRQAPLDLDYSTVGSNVMLIPTASMKSGTFKLILETRQRQLITVDKAKGWLGGYDTSYCYRWSGLVFSICMVAHNYLNYPVQRIWSLFWLPWAPGMIHIHTFKTPKSHQKKKKERESCSVVYLALSPSGAMLCPIFCDSIFTVTWQNLPTINKMFKD